MPAIWFDTNFFVWLSLASEAEVDRAQQLMRDTGSRILTSHFESQEYLNRGSSTKGTDSLLSRRLEGFLVQNLSPEMGQVTWQDLSLPPENREDLKNTLTISKEAIVKAMCLGLGNPSFKDLRNGLEKGFFFGGVDPGLDLIPTLRDLIDKVELLNESEKKTQELAPALLPLMEWFRGAQEILMSFDLRPDVKQLFNLFFEHLSLCIKAGSPMEFPMEIQTHPLFVEERIEKDLFRKDLKNDRRLVRYACYGEKGKRNTLPSDVGDLKRIRFFAKNVEIVDAFQIDKRRYNKEWEVKRQKKRKSGAVAEKNFVKCFCASQQSIVVTVEEALRCASRVSQGTTGHE